MYVARTSSQVLSALLYRIERSEVVVINECTTLEDKEVSRFTNFIFKRFPDIDVIRFHAVDAQIDSLAFPVQLYRCSEDFVLGLPATVEEYYSQLGKSTRSYINRYLNKIKRNFPSFTFEAFTGNDIREEDVSAVFEMNRARMAERGIVYGYSANYPSRALQLLRDTGLLCVVKIDGKICAGTILYCVEGEYFLESLSHRSEYNDVGLGTLCCYLSICECIRRRGKVYHFLWGRYDYKLRLGGVERPLSNVMVYRSRTRMLKHSSTALKLAAKGCVYQMKMWVQVAAEQGHPLARFVDNTYWRFRRMRIKTSPP